MLEVSIIAEEPSVTTDTTSTPLTSAARVPVSERALVARINRKLKPESKQLRRTRGERAIREHGYYHIIDWNLNVVLGYQDLNIETLGRELGVLKAWERVVWEDEEGTE
jgi:hypothetical protein